MNKICVICTLSIKCLVMASWLANNNIASKLAAMPGRLVEGRVVTGFRVLMLIQSGIAHFQGTDLKSFIQAMCIERKSIMIA